MFLSEHLEHGMMSGSGVHFNRRYRITVSPTMKSDCFPAIDLEQSGGSNAHLRLCDMSFIS